MTKDSSTTPSTNQYMTKNVSSKSCQFQTRDLTCVQHDFRHSMTYFFTSLVHDFLNIKIKVEFTTFRWHESLSVIYDRERSKRQFLLQSPTRSLLLWRTVLWPHSFRRLCVLFFSLSIGSLLCLLSAQNTFQWHYKTCFCQTLRFSRWTHARFLFKLILNMVLCFVVCVHNSLSIKKINKWLHFVCNWGFDVIWAPKR